IDVLPHSALLRSLDEVPEVIDRAELRMDRGMPSLAASDRPRAARILLLGALLVVAPLAKCFSDGMDGREIEDVQSHPGQARKLRFHIAKRPVLILHRGRRPREELVPGAERRSTPIDLDPHLACVTSHESK